MQAAAGLRGPSRQRAWCLRQDVSGSRASAETGRTHLTRRGQGALLCSVGQSVATADPACWGGRGARQLPGASLALVAHTEPRRAMNIKQVFFPEVGRAVLRETDLDEQLGPTEALIRNRYSGISSGTEGASYLGYGGPSPPTTAGASVVGEIVALGSEVT